MNISFKIVLTYIHFLRKNSESCKYWSDTTNPKDESQRGQRQGLVRQEREQRKKETLKKERQILIFWGNELKERTLFRQYSAAVIRIHKAEGLWWLQKSCLIMCSEMGSNFVVFTSFLDSVHCFSTGQPLRWCVWPRAPWEGWTPSHWSPWICDSCCDFFLWRS